MQGVHRPGGTDRSLLWGTATLLLFTLGAITVARTTGGSGPVTESTPLCYNSAGVASACLPEPPAATEPTVEPVETTPVARTPAGTTPTAPTPTARKPTTEKPSATPSTKVAVPAWRVGVAYGVGARVMYRGQIYECRQAHTSQADWTPPATPALWARVG